MPQRESHGTDHAMSMWQISSNLTAFDHEPGILQEIFKDAPSFNSNATVCPITSALMLTAIDVFFE